MSCVASVIEVVGFDVINVKGKEVNGYIITNSY